MNKSLQFLNSILHPYQEGKVKFILSGSASDYNITYKSSEDQTNHLPHADKSWKHRFSAREGDYVYFSAQSNQPGKHVRVKIVYNGRVFKESTSSARRPSRPTVGASAPTGPCHRPGPRGGRAAGGRLEGQFHFLLKNKTLLAGFDRTNEHYPL
jgi:hypothetical protein